MTKTIVALALTMALGAAGSGQTQAPATLALVGGRIHPAPDAVPIDDGVVIVENGRVTSVGPRASTSIPTAARVIDCKGLVVTAAFQNSHVHFTDPRWADAARQPAAKLGAQLEEMLTRYGFTTVVDTASFLENTLALRDIATAAALEAHRQGKLVFVHPSNGAGLEVALRASADVLAHAVDDTRDTTPDQWARMRRQDVAIVPTIKLFGGRFAWDILDEVRDYARAGGQILFGTDVGYLKDFDPTVEYDFMSAAGLGWREILASLTTSPALRFGEQASRGRIAPGLAADLVVLGSDPVRGPRAFVGVRWTIRGGRVIYEGR